MSLSYIFLKENNKFVTFYKQVNPMFVDGDERIIPYNIAGEW